MTNTAATVRPGQTERQKAYMELRRLGLTYREIGLRMGVTSVAASQGCKRYRDWESGALSSPGTIDDLSVGLYNCMINAGLPHRATPQDVYALSQKLDLKKRRNLGVKRWSELSDWCAKYGFQI